MSNKRAAREPAVFLARISVERFSVTSSLPFESVAAGIESRIAHPSMSAFMRKLRAAKSLPELERAVQRAVGSLGLMEFARYDLGDVLRKELGNKAPRVLRLVVGNPLVMMKMVKRVHDAGSYAPATILIDERPDGVRLSYDRMASLIAPYGNLEALQVARDLDAKIEHLLTAAAGGGAAASLPAPHGAGE